MKFYCKPSISSTQSFETSALSCGKTTDPPPGSFHFGSGYSAFTGHFGGGFGGSESVSGSALGGTPGMSSQSYQYSGLCQNWVTWQS